MTEVAKSDRIQKERARLQEIFKDADKSRRELIEKLIDEAAFISVENEDLKAAMEITGMVKIHPSNPGFQKPVEAAKQYRQNVNSYAVIIKTLNGVLTKDVTGEEDPLDEWFRERKQRRSGE